MKNLTKSELERRRMTGNYFKNGKPKKSAMLCHNREYIAEVTRINGYCNPDWMCGGSRCPLYATGCDNKGRDWDE